MIDDSRVEYLNSVDEHHGEYVLYWMQSSVRAEYNHALEYAVSKSIELDQPLAVVFCLTDNYPHANLRHYRFLVEGLVDVHGTLFKRRINMQIVYGPPVETMLELSANAASIIVDRGYTRQITKWVQKIGSKVKCPFTRVESNIVIPVEVTSDKEEYSAATIRRKINRLLGQYLKPFELADQRPKTVNLDVPTLPVDVEKIIKGLKVDRSVKPVEGFRGGPTEAGKRLETFLGRIDDYPDKRNDPNEDGQSQLSPYLHFGHISPLHLALRVKEADSRGTESFLEELIVRRELAINFVHYNSEYDSIRSLPDWCIKTLREHQSDPREYTYTIQELENAETHDPYWNAAQVEMMETGKMHGYMRMYWGKKILEWTSSPEESISTAIKLNDKYQIDGRDPNSYSGIMWVHGKHDRPWKERPIFGKIRYMNDKGLERKFRIKKYAEKWCRN